MMKKEEAPKVVVTVTEPKVVEVAEQSEGYTSLGEFKITYYCGCEKCNGKWAGVTATGKNLEVGMVAADPSIPFGTELFINEDGMMAKYTVEDRGVKGNHIDIYVPDHEMARQLGVLHTEVFVKAGN